MTTKSLVILGFWIVAIVLFALVGLDIVNETKYDLVALGLAFGFVGFAVDKFWATA